MFLKFKYHTLNYTDNVYNIKEIYTARQWYIQNYIKQGAGSYCNKSLIKKDFHYKGIPIE